MQPGGVISTREECAARGRFEIKGMIIPWIVWNKVQQLINRSNNKFTENFFLS